MRTLGKNSLLHHCAVGGRGYGGLGREWRWLLLWLVGYVAWACDVPVFKYSLQAWPPDAFEVVVAHDGEAEAERLVEELNGYVDKGANMVVRQSATAKVSERYDIAAEALPTAVPPWLIVRYPVRQDRRALFRCSAAGEVALGELVDSPKRREIAKLLLEGSAGVWVFLEGSNRANNETAYKLLTSELKRLERTMRVEDEAGEPISFFFGVVRLAHSGAEEEVLRRMLLHSESDLGKFKDDPMVFPIYGRGMILYALVGKGVNEAMIREAAEFLTGDCSCEVKSLNPGLELLMTVDWGEVDTVGLGLDSFGERVEQATALIGELERQAAQPQSVPQHQSVVDAAAARSEGAEEPVVELTVEQEPAAEVGGRARGALYGGVALVGLLGLGVFLGVRRWS